MLLLGLVLLARGMEYLNQRVSYASRTPAGPAAAEAAARAAEAAIASADAGLPLPEPMPPSPPARPVLPPPSDTLILALESSDAEARASALRQLRQLGSTPELQASLAALASRASSPWEQRFVACLRGRHPETPLSQVLDGLPLATDDRDWSGEPVKCLIDVVAARAGEDPARTAPILVARALVEDRVAITEGLRRLGPQAIPPVVLDATTPASGRMRRAAAVRTAVALGAAATAPDAVSGWLDDADASFRAATIRHLIARPDDASQAAAARALASSPGDGPLEWLAMEELRKGGGLDRHLAALAADDTVPNFARAQAANLVSRAGGEAAARAVIALPVSDATIKPEMDAAVRRVAQRFGSSGRGGR